MLSSPLADTITAMHLAGNALPVIRPASVKSLGVESGISNRRIRICSRIGQARICAKVTLVAISGWSRTLPGPNIAVQLKFGSAKKLAAALLHVLSRNHEMTVHDVF